MGALSNDLEKYDKRIGALSNTLVTKYIKKGDKLGSLYPSDGLQNIGNLDDAWLEGHFCTVFANDMFVSHPEGGGRRVMLEGDDLSCEDFIDNPVQVILPVWVNSLQEDVPLSSFRESLDYTKIVNSSLPTVLPNWLSTLLQSSILLCDFLTRLV